MTEGIKTWWLDMTEAQLTNHLTNKLKYPPPIVAGLVKQVKAHREAKRAAKIRATQVKKLWDVIINAARAELRTVRVLKHQTKSAEPMDEAKWNALCEYDTEIGRAHV